MGHDLSRIVNILHPLPKSQQLAALDQLLQDKTLYKSLVKAAKAANFGFTLQRAPVKPKSTALQTLEPSRTVDSRALETWSNDLSVFWKSPQFKFDPWSGELATFYDGTLEVVGSRDLYAIRGRFMKLFYFDLLHLLNPLAACDKATGKVYDRLADIIARKSKASRDPQLVRPNLTAWVRAGRRYHKLATNFGPAILFVLPDTFSIDFLEKRLPLEDEAFKIATQHLAPLKEYAEKLDGDYKVAEQLREKTLAPYAFLKEELSASTDSQARKPSSGCAIHSETGEDSGMSIGNVGDEQNDRQDAVQCAAAAIDTDMSEEGVEHGPHSENSRNENQLRSPPPDTFNENFSLDYYIDPSLFDAGSTLEYYLNVDSRLGLVESPAVQTSPTPQNANALLPSLPLHVEV